MSNQANNWNAGMEMMAAMMSMFSGQQQQHQKVKQAAPVPPPPQVSSDYGYSGGPNSRSSNNTSRGRSRGRFTQSGYGRSDGPVPPRNGPVPPPPPPPPEIREDIPMPPEYSYPRHLEPTISDHARAREEADRAGWKRKTDVDLDDDRKKAKSNPEAVGKALSLAAQKAKEINSKLGSQGPKFQENAPFTELDKERAMMEKMVTYAVPMPVMKEKGAIANVPFERQQEMRRTHMLHQQFLGVGAFGNQSDSIRGAPVKWNKKTKRYEERLGEEKVDWAMTQHYRKLTKPVEGSLTMGPKQTGTRPVNEKPIPSATEFVEYGTYKGQIQIMSKNDPTKPPGLHGQCFDDEFPDEDEILDVKMRPKYHFYFGKTWSECVDPVKRDKLCNRKPWQRGAYNPAELDAKYIEKQKIDFARRNALKLLEGIEDEKKEENSATIDVPLTFVNAQVQAKIAKTSMVPPPTSKTMVNAPQNNGYHKASTINRTDVLTWTSQRGHTNQVNSKGLDVDSSIAVAGNQIKPGANKKHTAPLQWNFVAETQNETKKTAVPTIGPILPGTEESKPEKPKARFVPPDIEPIAAEALLNIITADKCDICSKSFIQNENARNAHLHSKKHYSKLNNWLQTKGFPSVVYKE